MNYQRIHDEIIADSRLSSPIGHKHNNKTMGYKERHHIVPKCLGGTNDSSNLIYLTARRHFIIHRLLTKIYPNNNKLWFAFSMMFCTNKTKPRHLDNAWVKSSSKKYSILKEKLSNYAKTRKHSKETRQKYQLKEREEFFQKNIEKIYL